MADLKVVLKNEITRLAKKEIKSAVEPLAAQIAGLKKVVSELKKEIAECKKLECAAVNAVSALPAKAILAEKPVRRKTRKEKAGKVGSVILQLRKKLKINQLEMSKLLGVNVGSITFWERGIVVPRPNVMAEIEKLKAMPKFMLKKVLVEKLGDSILNKKRSIKKKAVKMK